MQLHEPLAQQQPTLPPHLVYELAAW